MFVILVENFIKIAYALESNLFVCHGGIVRIVHIN